MKKFSKILSSALVVCMLVSCFAITAFADTQARTFTVKTDKAGVELKAGDVVTVEVVADTLLHSWNAGYTLSFDPAVFTIDTASGGMGKPKKYVDVAWHNTIKDDTKVVGFFWGSSRTSSESASEGTIICAWSGNTDAGSGVLAEYNETDYTIGKYYLTVIEGAKAGATSITVTGETFGWKENSADAMTYVPATLTVAGAAPAGPSIGAGSAAGAGSGLANIANAYAVTVSMTGIKDAVSSAGVEFIPAAVYTKAAYAADGAWDLAAKATFSSTKIGKGDADFVAHLMGIPVDTLEAGVDMKARAFFVKDGVTTYGSVIDQLVKK